MKNIFSWHRVWVIAASLTLIQVPAFAQSSVDTAWTKLQAGLAEKDNDNRSAAVRVLGLLEGNPKAGELAMVGLEDKNPDVRAAATEVLGQLKVKSAVPKLRDLVKNEKEVSVVIASARALVTLNDPVGYAAYFAVLTGEKKSGGSIIGDQEKMLKDPKKMAQFGFNQGIGYIPFAGIGYGVFKAVTKDDASPVRAAAAKVLANDPDPHSGDALVKAASDKSWIVRAAALDAIAHRNDPSLAPQIESSLSDDNAIVRYTASAAIIHLNDVSAANGRKAKK